MMRQSLYVASTGCGIIKVGRTSKLENRHSQLSSQCKALFGVGILQMVDCGQLLSLSREAEADALMEVRFLKGVRCMRYEWFTGVDRSVAEEITREAVRRYIETEKHRAKRETESLERWALRQLREGIFS